MNIVSFLLSLVVVKALHIITTPISSLSISAIHKLPRLYVPDSLIANTQLTLNEENAHYVKNVMRLRAGSHLRVFNPQHGEFVSMVHSLSKGKRSEDVSIEVHSKCRSAREDSYPTKLLFSPIKKDKLKLLIEKGTELGVRSFHPIITQNCNTDITSSAMQESLQHVIVQSVEQSERLSIPSLETPISLSQLIQSWNTSDLNSSQCQQSTHSRCFVCRERSDRTHIPSFLQALHSKEDILTASKDPFSVMIGPEGGFTEQEFLQLQPFVTFVSLGNNVLRAETAGIAALSIVSSWFEFLVQKSLS